MANNPQQQSYQEAYGHLKTRVYDPVFFGKLASDYGLYPSDQEEANLLLGLADWLRTAEGQQAVKKSSDRKTLLKEALYDLNQVMGGQQTPPALQATDQNIKVAASQVLANQPELRDAALLYRDYLAQVLAQQQQPAA